MLRTSGITFYDDRKYIGAFLSIFALAKSKDANVEDNAFIRAGAVLFKGVSDDWIDEPTGLWDDGRPLICFTQDALLGLVSYSLTFNVEDIHQRFGDGSTPPRLLKVFLCHSSGDKPAVRGLYHRLCAKNVEPWLDEENLLPGQDWNQEISKAVRASDVVIVCLSHGAINKAGYIQKEIRYALDVADEQPEGTIFLIPLKLEECEVPERLRRLQWVNLFEEGGFERLMRALRLRSNSMKGVII